MTESASVPAARGAELFERMRRWWVDGEMTGEHFLAEDVVVEMPFAPPGRPRRVAGRAEFQTFAEAGRAALPVRIEDCRNVVIHQTTDPDVIVFEYEIVASLIGSDRRAAAPFIGVLTTRNGQIVNWREYQNVLAMAEAMGQLPALLADSGGHQPDAAPSVVNR